MRNDQPSTINHQRVVIVANGRFPEHEIPLKALHDAGVVVCCDGATSKVLKSEIIPTAIVGDLDSLSSELRSKYADRIFHDSDQNTNDLTKAIKWCFSKNHKDITIIGATGLREDHTLGNIGLLPSYLRLGVNVVMLTDTGIFTPLLESSTLKSFVGQQVSIFTQTNGTRITSTNLKYPLNGMELDELWKGTLNESLGNCFRLEFDKGSLIVFQKY